jgi:hypothetical protein
MATISRQAASGASQFLRAFLRNIAKIISAIPLYIGFLLAAFTARKQALHDMVTNCLVVRPGPSHFVKALAAAVGGLVIAAGAPEAAPAPEPVKSVAATPPPAQGAKMDSEPRARRAPRRRVTPPAALPAPAPAVASAPAAEPITPKYNDVMTAVMYGDEGAVNQLLDLGWWVDKPSSTGLTPLMGAVMRRDTRIVQVLLVRGADPNAQAPGGVTPLMLARDRNDAATATLLEQRGAR